MPVFLLKQDVEYTGAYSDRASQFNICAIMAGDSEEAEYKAELYYGGDWEVLKNHKTLEEVRYMVEDSKTEAIMLNL